MSNKGKLILGFSVCAVVSSFSNTELWAFFAFLIVFYVIFGN